MVAHNASFDMDCLAKSLEEYNISPLENSYACTIKSCQKVLPKQDSYRLPELAKALEIELDHHNSASDAMACARLALITLPQLKHQELFYMPQKEVTSNIKKLKNETSADVIKTRGGYGTPNDAVGKNLKKSDVPLDLEHADENSPFYNKKTVFTGDLEGFSRLEAAQHAQKMRAFVNRRCYICTHFLNRLTYRIRK